MMLDFSLSWRLVVYMNCFKVAGRGRCDGVLMISVVVCYVHDTVRLRGLIAEQ